MALQVLGRQIPCYFWVAELLCTLRMAPFPEKKKSDIRYRTAHLINWLSHSQTIYPKCGTVVPCNAMASSCTIPANFNCRTRFLSKVQISHEQNFYWTLQSRQQRCAAYLVKLKHLQPLIYGDLVPYFMKGLQDSRLSENFTERMKCKQILRSEVQWMHLTLLLKARG